MYNTLHIESLRNATNEINKGMAVFREYCTDECIECPLKDLCDWECRISTDDARLTDDLLDEFVEFYKAHEDTEMDDYTAMQHYYSIPSLLTRI